MFFFVSRAKKRFIVIIGAMGKFFYGAACKYNFVVVVDASILLKNVFEKNGAMNHFDSFL